MYLEERDTTVFVLVNGVPTVYIRSHTGDYFYFVLSGIRIATRHAMIPPSKDDSFLGIFVRSQTCKENSLESPFYSKWNTQRSGEGMVKSEHVPTGTCMLITMVRYRSCKVNPTIALLPPQ